MPPSADADALPAEDPIGDVLDEIGTKEIVQVRRGRTLTWTVRMLGPEAVYAVPELLDRIMAEAAKRLPDPDGHHIPEIAAAQKAIRERNRPKPEVEAADIFRRLQLVAVEAVESLTVADRTDAVRLVMSRAEQTPKGTLLPAGQPRRVWVGTLDRSTLQAIYFAAAAQLEEAVAQAARFCLLLNEVGPLGPMGPRIWAAALAVSQPEREE
jgi:hypothetical protein